LNEKIVEGFTKGIRFKGGFQRRVSKEGFTKEGFKGGFQRRVSKEGFKGGFQREPWFPWFTLKLIIKMFSK
jgi:hypothetical protein